MAGGIFIVQENGGLTELTESPYEAEEVLQKLLADHPNILAGDQFDPALPRRWLLVSREMSIPDQEGGAGRWSLDHLYLDQDGIPTLVEVKRSSDTRIRREVVGQMLDYAANAVVYWPAESIRAKYEAMCLLTNRSSEELLADSLGAGIDQESFWQSVRQNLQAGRVRLVFVADVIPTELQRIVEFLNGQMNPAEVIAVEVRQYVGLGVRALVPRVVGQTAAAQQKKKEVGASTKREWNEDDFISVLAEQRGTQEVESARAVLRWAERKGLQIKWGQGPKLGAFSPMVGSDSTITVWTDGNVEVLFGNLVSRSKSVPNHPFASDEARLDLLHRFNQIPGVNFDEARIAKLPSFKLTILVDSGARQRLFEVLDWFVAQLRESESA